MVGWSERFVGDTVKIRWFKLRPCWLKRGYMGSRRPMGFRMRSATGKRHWESSASRRLCNLLIAQNSTPLSAENGSENGRGAPGNGEHVIDDGRRRDWPQPAAVPGISRGLNPTVSTQLLSPSQFGIRSHSSLQSPSLWEVPPPPSLPSEYFRHTSTSCRSRPRR